MDKDAIKAQYVARRDRKEDPDGRFDRGGRWYPSESERASCCDKVRSPSGMYPYSLLVHCRSKKHIETRESERNTVVE